MIVRTRIAPTPSGFLHIGNLYSFFITWLLARKQQGKILLRIDDLDNRRMRKEYLDDIFETLRFTGLDYDEGPVDIQDFQEHYSQQFSMHRYEVLLTELVNTGLVYACTCSRKENQFITNFTAIDACRYLHLPLDTPGASWRILVPEKTFITFQDEMIGAVVIDLAKEMPDFIIRKKDGNPSYQVASLSNDIHFSINYIVRGQDLLASSAAQLYLASLINHQSFSENTFLHHPLLKNEHGEKLSKSAGSQSIQVLRKNGVDQSGFCNLLCKMPGFKGIEISRCGSILECLNQFSIDGFLKNLRSQGV